MTDSIVIAWQRTVAWLQANAPAALAQLQGPAATPQLDEIALDLPVAVRTVT